MRNGSLSQLRNLIAGDDSLENRLEQFVQESEHIIPSAAAALSGARLDLFAQLVARSAAGAVALLGNQVPETVALMHAALKNGAVAASPFGAGFGGSVWAIVNQTHVHAFMDQLLVNKSIANRQSAFWTRPSSGAQRIV